MAKNSSFANFGLVSACAVCKCAVLCVGFHYLVFILVSKSSICFSVFLHLAVTVTCKLSLRISELVPVRQDGTMLRESSERHTTNPAMQFTICYALLFILHYLFFHILRTPHKDHSRQPLQIHLRI